MLLESQHSNNLHFISIIGVCSYGVSDAIARF